MYLFDYKQNPKMFWLTMLGLVVVVFILWQTSTPQCDPSAPLVYGTNSPQTCH